MMRGCVGAAFAAVVAVFGAVAAKAAVIESAQFGGWTIASIADDDRRQFARCEATSETQNDARLVIMANRDRSWGLGFAGRLGVQAGETSPVSLRVDGGRPIAGVARAVSATLVTMRLEGEGTIRNLTFGRQLAVDAGSDGLSFSLRGVRPVVAALQTCLERWEGRTLPQQAAAGTAATGSIRLGPPGSTERRLEAMTTAVNLLSQAQVVGFQLQPADGPDRLKGHDVTWRAQGVAGSLRLLDGEGAPDMRKLRSELVSADIQACDGSFSAEAAAPKEGGIAELSTSCQGPKGWSARYLVSPRPERSYVVSLVGAADAADGLRRFAEPLRAGMSPPTQSAATPAPADAQGPPAPR